MRINYQISYKNFVEAQKALLGPRLHLTWTLGAIFIFLGTLELILNPQEYPGAIAILILGCVFAFCWRWSIRRMYRRDDRFKHSYEAMFSETGIDINGPTSASQYRWENFVGHKNTNNTVVLFHSPSLFTAFPKSASTQPNSSRLNILWHSMYQFFPTNEAK